MSRIFFRSLILPAVALLLPACQQKEWVTTDGGHSYQNRKGEVQFYEPRTSHGFWQEFQLTLLEPTSENLPDWKLSSVAPDGTVTLRFIAVNTDHTVSAKPGEMFPQYGNQHLRVVSSSPEDESVRLSLSDR